MDTKSYRNFQMGTFNYADDLLTVKKYLVNWLEQKKESGIQLTSYQNYAATLKPIWLVWGEIGLVELTPERILEVVDFLAQENRNDLARHMVSVLRMALEQAVGEQLIPANPAKTVKLLPIDKSEVSALSAEMHKIFLQAIEGHRLQPYFEFLLNTGMLAGEVHALRWTDIDYEKNKIVIRNGARREKGEAGEKSKIVLGPTKSKRSRTLELEQTVLRILQQQWNLQKKEMRAADYLDQGLVFATKRGSFLETSSTNRTLNCCIKPKMRILYAQQQGIPVEDVELPKFTLHSLRHTFATRALEADIPLKVVSEWLGHSTVRVTGDIYSHVSPEMRCASLKQLEQYLTKTFAFSSEKSPETESF